MAKFGSNTKSALENRHKIKENAKAKTSEFAAERDADRETKARQNAEEMELKREKFLEEQAERDRQLKVAFEFILELKEQNRLARQAYDKEMEGFKQKNSDLNKEYTDQVNSYKKERSVTDKAAYKENSIWAAGKQDIKEAFTSMYASAAAKGAEVWNNVTNSKVVQGAGKVVHGVGIAAHTVGDYGKKAANAIHNKWDDIQSKVGENPSFKDYAKVLGAEFKNGALSLKDKAVDGLKTGYETLKNNHEERVINKYQDKGVFEKHGYNVYKKGESAERDGREFADIMNNAPSAEAEEVKGVG